MVRWIAFTALSACVTSAALAGQPNMQPGSWEYTNRTSFSGPMKIPDQKRTHTQCVKQEDIEKGDTFLENASQCSVANSDVGTDEASYTIVCPTQQGGEMRMDIDMHMMGDRVSGEARASLKMNGQSMDMVTKIEGKRVGDC